MKKHFGKLTGLALAIAMTLTLPACSANAGTAAPTSVTPSAAPVQESAPASTGTLLLSVNPEIEMQYDKNGNVVALTGLNDDGRELLTTYTGYKGRPCKAVIGELVNKINAAGYFAITKDGQEKNIVLKLARGSQYPNDGFLDELADAVRVVVDAGQIGAQPVALDEDDYDEAYGDKGFINASAARNLLSTQLGRSDIQFLDKEYDLDDGDYEIEFMLDGVKYEYEVDALTGKVNEVDIDRQDNGVTDYDDTDYGPNNDGVTDYDDTDYGPNNDGVTDYDDTDYGSNDDNVTDYDNGNSNYDDGGSDYDDDDD